MTTQAKNLPDIVNLTRSTFKKTMYDSAGLAQLYPEMEIVKQSVQARRMVEDTSYEIESTLEKASPDSSEETGVNHPLEVSAPAQSRTIKTRLVTYRTTFTWSEFEKTFQGKSDEKLVDALQMRFTNNDRKHWELLENKLLSTDFETSTVDRFRSLLYWVTDNSSQTAAYAAHGGLDPIASGRAGVTIAAEPDFTNAVGVFSKVSQDDLFNIVSKFLHEVKMQAVVPHPQVAPEAPSRVLYVQTPVKLAAERLLTASNENVGDDLGFYRGASMYRGIPITIWHALASPESPVRPDASQGVGLLIDWNTFMLQVHSDWNRQTLTGEVANTPAQYWEGLWTMLNLHNTRPDRNMYLRTSSTDLLPDAV